MKLHKTILLSLLFTSLSSKANDVELLLKGGFDFQAGYFSSNAPKKSDNDATAKPNYITQNQKNLAFLSTAYVGITAQNTLESGFIYGAKIALDTTTKSSRKMQSCIFMENYAGRVELGSEKSAMSKMRITPYSVAAGPGDAWDMWVKTDPVGAKDQQIPYATGFSNFLDQKMRASGRVEYSRKVTYYTPEFYGFQIGVSYIPDSSNVGYSEIKDESIRYTPSRSKYYFTVRNGFASGITYSKEFSKDTKLKLSFVNETGKVVAKPKDPNTTVPYDFGYLNTYNFGAQLTMGKVSIAASYGDYMRSLTTKDQLRRKTQIYGVGAKYAWDKDLSTSITYVKSEHMKNQIYAITLGADYKLAPGLLPYAGITYFSTNGKYNHSQDEKPSVHKGVIGIVGTKLEF
ncbi:MAG: porin [Rickettsiaceae bacterium]|nr:porin [Rickettsiaceae bacterium]